MKKHSNDLIGDIVKAFGKYADRPAFVIEDTACTYGELATCVQKISSLFKDREDKIIGIVAENRLETYASILSALICGKAYVILHPSYPKHRNDRIAGLAGIRLVLHTENIHVLNLDTRNLELICTSEMRAGRELHHVPCRRRHPPYGRRGKCLHYLHFRKHGRTQRSAHLPPQPECFLYRLSPPRLATGRERPDAADVRTHFLMFPSYPFCIR